MSRMCKAVEWPERCHGYETLTTFISQASPSELQAKQTTLTDLFVDGVSDRYPRVVLKTLDAIAAYLERPIYQNGMVSSPVTQDDEDYLARGGWPLDLLVTVLPRLLSLAQDQQGLTETGSRISQLILKRYKSNIVLDCISSMLNDPQWMRHSKVKLGSLLLICTMSSLELGAYCSKAESFKTLLLRLSGLCSETEPLIVQKLKQTLAILYSTQEAGNFLQVYSKLPSQRKRALAQLFHIQGGDIAYDVKAFESQITKELNHPLEDQVDDHIDTQQLAKRSRSPTQNGRVTTYEIPLGTSHTLRLDVTLPTIDVTFTHPADDKDGCACPNCHTVIPPRIRAISGVPTTKQIEAPAPQVEHAAPQVEHHQESHPASPAVTSPASDLMDKFSHVAPRVEQLEEMARTAASNDESTVRQRRAPPSDSNETIVSRPETKVETEQEKDIELEVKATGNTTLYYFIASFATGFLLWSVMSISGAVTTRPEFDKSYDKAETYYGYAAMTFAMGIAFSYMGFSGASNYEKKTLSATLLAVNVFAFLCYMSIWFKFTPTLVDPYLKTPVYPIRYLEWITCCPTLIIMIAQITQTKKNLYTAIAADYMVVITGFLGAALPAPWSVLFNFLSFAAFYVVMDNMWKYYTNAIERPKQGAADAQSLQVLRVTSLIAWNAFPAVWLLQNLQIVSHPTAEALYVCADILAKVFFTLVLVNSSVEQAQNVKVQNMARLTNTLEGKIQEADKLLNNLLPESVVQQMKKGKKAEAEEYECVTVFFSDITNFTVLSSRTATKDMMATLNKLWVEYDAIAKRHKVHKVETIGDAYLGVTGCPDRCSNHAEQAAGFALDIIDMIKTFKTVTGESIQIRIGLHSGPVTAGVLGDLVPHWCLVGDTVNTASRMESTSSPMKIHISDSTYKLIAHKFKTDPLPLMDVKGKGKMQTYWLTGRH